MELLTPFNQYICDRKLSEAEVIKLGCDICTALEICQKRNIIHRDIKPENIFVNDFGDFKLGDFGIARKMENVTGGLSQKGTFNYMAPEVAGNGSYDGRADIYSLGIVLYRLLNQNRLPFLDTQKQLLSPNERRAAVERRLRGEPLPAPCEASPTMAALVLSACAYDPNKRFSNPTAMKRALLNVGNSRGGQGTQSVNQTFARGTGTGFSQVSQESGYAQGQNPNFMEQTVRVRRAPQSQMPQNQNQGGGFSQPPAPKKKKRWWLVLLLVLLSAAVIGGGVFAAVMLKETMTMQALRIHLPKPGKPWAKLFLTHSLKKAQENLWRKASLQTMQRRPCRRHSQKARWESHRKARIQKAAVYLERWLRPEITAIL